MTCVGFWIRWEFHCIVLQIYHFQFIENDWFRFQFSKIENFGKKINWISCCSLHSRTYLLTHSTHAIWIKETVRWAPMVVQPNIHTHAHTRTLAYSPCCMYWYLCLSSSELQWFQRFIRIWYGAHMTVHRRGSISIPFHLCTYIRSVHVLYMCKCIHIALAIRFDSIYSFTECVPSSYHTCKEWERRKQTEATNDNDDDDDDIRYAYVLVDTCVDFFSCCCCLLAATSI